CPFERVVGFAFVETDGDSPPEFGVLQPFQREQRSFDSADLPQRGRQWAVARVARQLADKQRRAGGAGSQRCRQPQVFIPVVANCSATHSPADQWLQETILRGLLKTEQAMISQIADPRCEAKAE